MTSTTSSPPRCPRLLAGSMILTPVLFFSLLVVTGPLGSFALYLFIAWSIAVITSTCTYVIDHQYVRQYTLSERLAMLSANGMVAILVALTGFMAFGFQ